MTTAAKPLVSFRDVRVDLGGRPVLTGVTADIARGKVTALIGLNGSGKTTLLRAILREYPYRGDIRFHCGHDHTDPHAWLAPDRAVLMVERVRDKLKEADPGHAADYDRRAAEYVVRLRKLQAEGRDQLKDKKDRNLVSFHDSLAYFADAFELKVVGVVQKTPGQEPNDDELRKLTEICTGTPKVRLIAVEPQYSTVTSAEEILKGLRRKGVADAAMVEIDPLETCLADDLTPDWYERKMRQNLQNLADKMK